MNLADVCFPFPASLFKKVYRKKIKWMLKPIQYLWTQITNIIVLFIYNVLPCSDISHLSIDHSVLYFRSPTLLLPASYAAWVYRETSIFTCMKEFYITEGDNQQHALSNCHIVGELRAFNENITCSILATILDLFKNNTHLFSSL